MSSYRGGRGRRRGPGSRPSTSDASSSSSSSSSSSNSDSNSLSTTKSNGDARAVGLAAAKERGNQVWVSGNKRFSYFADITLRLMVEHEYVELHGLGEAVAATIEIGQFLVNAGRATLSKIGTRSANVNGPAKPELFMILKRTGIPELPPTLSEDQEQLLNLTEDKREEEPDADDE